MCKITVSLKSSHAQIQPKMLSAFATGSTSFFELWLRGLSRRDCVLQPRSCEERESVQAIHNPNGQRGCINFGSAKWADARVGPKPFQGFASFRLSHPG